MMSAENRFTLFGIMLWTMATAANVPYFLPT